jgi:hypothetical protein
VRLERTKQGRTAMADTLNESERKEWQRWAEDQKIKLTDEYKKKYHPNGLDSLQVYLIPFGIKKRIDNKFGNAEDKRHCYQNKVELNLADLMTSKESSSSLQPLKDRLIKEYGFTEKEANIPGDSLRATLAILDKANSKG